MNLSEVNWDFDAAGSWPLPLKIVAGLIISIAVAVGGYYYLIKDQIAELDTIKQEEISLKNSFETKQRKAVNLKDYKAQLDQIEASLGEMIKQMPTKAEVANLLVDISQTGLASGLEFKLFKPGGEIRKEFYSELPINIEVIGDYEELGLFVSGLASLPRIVTVHDVNMKPNAPSGMAMKATVKTYNEGVDQPAPKKKKRRKK